jgi:mono/diheme cytochrome c family protein
MTQPWTSLVLFGILLATGASLSAPRPDQLRDLDLGRHVFLTYCSGCHGFDGLAFYPAAPSFAMGDRLAKSDAELLRSIFRGRGAMPSWEDKLPEDWLKQSLAYIRHMARKGVSRATGNRPERYYIFAPMGSDLRLDWHIPPP